MTTRAGRDDRRRMILATTVDLIAERGVDAVRLRDVAAAAGISVGMIQHYFDGRDQLIEEAFRTYSASVIEQLREVTAEQSEAAGQLAALCQAAAVRAGVKKRSAMWLGLAAASPRNAALRRVAQSVYQAWIDAFCDVLTRGVANGEFPPDVDPFVASEQLAVMVDGLDVASVISRRGATRQWRDDRLCGAAEALVGVRLNEGSTK